MALDDYIDEDNAVRFIDVFADTLGLKRLDFKGAPPADTGRLSYRPSILLKIYICNYLNRIHSSRRLERAAQRNVELMCCTGRLAPAFVTIRVCESSNSSTVQA